MTEDEARHWLVRHVPRETIDRFERFVTALAVATQHQNLIAKSTIENVWSRHVVDSAQLDLYRQPGVLLDIGSGAGFPGVILAAMRNDAVTLSEPRRLRVQFLEEAAAMLGLENVAIEPKRVEAITAAAPFANIVARAVAPLGSIFAMAAHVADPATRWILPKGRNAHAELAEARETWHGDFRLVNSVSDSEAAIIVATDVRRKSKREAAR